ncbi:DNA-processing protein DprA [Plebeiibacterium marinum]|uniref:DNA-processing protein DprA n=1 Tax=Plebeiibacterium marinum TaxID=2992111 RepID=A0AAE3MBW1_9BACT|nr:DNA-processing protein DprA [Plebeiobacterium marinum]MCW3805038.1 DNA-processing protein DprA [Plebeiobacterium marinum]
MVKVNQTDLKYQIAISLIKGIGPVLIRNIIAYLGDVEAVFREKEGVLGKIPGVGAITASLITKSNTLERAEKELEFIEKNNLKASFFLDDTFPVRLNQCEDAPVMIYHKGNHSLEGQKLLAVVGTRNVTEAGKENCRNLIRDISRYYPNTTIVSGLAYGVDICAHKAALEFGLPTIAVLAHGLDRIYPGMHRDTAANLLAKGALVTEFMSGTNPDRQNFVKRNRIIAGLADATLVVESAEKGGSLITAHLAQSYNRDVLAFPGRIDDEFSRGCNKLIKTNVAAMIEKIEDVEYALGWERKEDLADAKQLTMFVQPEGDAGIVYNMVRQEKEATLNLVSLKTGMPVNKISSLMLQLEFDGLVKSLPGNVYRCL